MASPPAMVYKRERRLIRHHCRYDKRRSKAPPALAAAANGDMISDNQPLSRCLSLLALANRLRRRGIGDEIQTSEKTV